MVERNLLLLAGAARRSRSGSRAVLPGTAPAAQAAAGRIYRDGCRYSLRVARVRGKIRKETDIPAEVTDD